MTTDACVVEAVSGRTIPVLIMRLADADGEAVSSTDVVYDPSGGAHHRMRKEGLQPHEKAHKDAATIVRVRRARDQVLWIADQPFSVKIEKRAQSNNLESALEPGSPFEWRERSCDGRRMIASGAALADAAEGFYKVTFTLKDGTIVDPDLDCRG